MSVRNLTNAAVLNNNGETGQGATSLTSAISDSYVWIGPVSGVWGTASNWKDVTTGANPAVTAPGALDNVTFNSATNAYQIISGTGSAANLTFTGENDIVGTVTAGNVAIGTVTNAGTLLINNAGTLSAASLALLASGSLTINTGSLAVSGSVTGGTFINATKANITVGGSLGSLVIAGTSTRVQAATANITAGGYFFADATSSIEFGSAGGAALGALTVDAGVNFAYSNSAGFAAYGIGIMASNGGALIDNGVITISGVDTAYLGGTSVSGSGKVVVQDGAKLGGGASGNLRFELGKGSSFAATALASTNTIAFTATGGVISLVGTLVSNNYPKANAYSYAMKAAIVGWDVTDIVNIDTAVTKAIFSNGSLVLTNGTTAVTTLTLTGNYAGRQFLVIATGTTQTPTSEIVLAAAAAPGPSAGTGNGDSFLWVGAASGDWNTAANWKDVTTGAQPASVAPGSTDNVVFDSAASTTYPTTPGAYQIISGVGNSQSLLMQGNNDVFGTLTTGVLTVGPPASGSISASYLADLRIGLGGQINATSVAFGTSGATTLTLAGGTLAVSGDVGAGRIKVIGGTLTAGGILAGSLDDVDNGIVSIAGAITSTSNLYAHNGARVQAASGFLFANVDAASSVEFGSAGNAALGALTIDAGVTASANGYINGFGTIVNNGTVTAAGFVQNASNTDSYTSRAKNVTIVGSGKFVLQDNAILSTTEGTVAAASLSFQLGANVRLSVGSVGTGNTIALNGGRDVLNVVNTDAFTTGPYDMKAAISGFDGTDVITINTIVDAATYSGGVLSLTKSGTTIATLNLTGNYTGRTFRAFATSAASSEIVLGAAAAAGPSVGTAAGHAYVYTGAIFGDWNTASNWTDSTAGGTPAGVAPGSKDSVSFNSPVAAYQIISGTGNSASLTFNGGLSDVVGTLATGALVAGYPLVNGQPSGSAGSLRINAGGKISATSVTAAYNVTVAGGTLAVSGNVTQGNFIVDAGTITVGGTLGSGLTASNGARVTVASANVTDAGFILDATSSMEVGSAGGAAAGALTVDAGAVLSFTRLGGSNSTNPQIVLVGNKLIDNGLITIGGTQAATLIAANSGTVGVSGTGRIVVQDGAILSTTGGTITAGSLGLEIGRGATLTVDKVVAGNTITFKAAGGALNIAPTYSTMPPYGYTYAMMATIAGFDATDAINVNSAITNADYNAGVLTLSNGTTAVTTLTVSGNYAGQSFLVVPVNGGTYQISLFAGSVFVAGNAITVGALAGATASLDLLFADTALVKNKTVNTLTINGPGTVTLGGAVTINNLFVSGNGVFVMNGAVVKTDPVTVDAGSNLSGSGTLTGLITDNGTITASGGTLILTDGVSGTGTLTMTAGATLELDSTVSGSVAIGFNAAGETLLLGAGAVLSDAITGFGAGDTIALKGQQIIVSSFDVPSHTLSVTGADNVVRRLVMATTNTAGDFTLQNGVVTDLACFARGTLIATPDGEIAVEQVVVGDRVRVQGGALSVMWVGWRRVNVGAHPDPDSVSPVHISADAFGAGLPTRTLVLSPDHAVFIDNVLIPVRMLINGSSIRQDVDTTMVDYFHIELERHAVMLACGLPVESYLDTGNRSSFADSGTVTSLHPSFEPGTLVSATPVARIATDVATVRPIWTRLSARAVDLGGRTWQPRTLVDNDMLVSTGKHFLHVWELPGEWFDLAVPPNTQMLWLSSRATSPAAIAPWCDDRRRLGLCIDEILFDTAYGPVPLALDDAALVAGWHATECLDQKSWRWTAGTAGIPVPRGATAMRFHVRARQEHLNNLNHAA